MTYFKWMRRFGILCLPALAWGQSGAPTAQACGEVTRALPMLQAEASPDEARLLHWAQLSLRCRQPKLALQGYQRVLRLNPRSLRAEVGLGQTYNYLRQYRQARQHLDAALRLSPGDADATWALARTALYQHQPQRAIDILQRGLRDHQGDYRLWESLGEAQLLRGKAAEAENDLQTALRLNPHAGRARRLLDTLPRREPLGSNPFVPRVEFHDSAYLLHDGLGNTVFSSPQELRFHAGRWTDQLRGEIERAGYGGGEGGYWGAGSAWAALDNEASLRVSDRLTVTGGGGEAHLLSSGRNRPLYNAGVTLTPIHGLRLQATYRQRMYTPTARAMGLGLTQRGWNVDMNFTPRDSRLSLNYGLARIRDGNLTRGGRGEYSRRVWEGPFDLWAGYRWEGFSYAQPSFGAGYFAPRRFHANTGVIRAQGDRGSWHFDWELGVGEESYRAQVGAPAGLVTLQPDHRSPRVLFIARNSVRVTSSLSLNLSYLAFRTTLGSGTGSYRAQGFLFGLTRRF